MRNQKANPYKQFCNQLAATPGQLELSSNEGAEMYIFNLSNQNSLLIQPITINYFKLNVLINSGSSLNTINERYLILSSQHQSWNQQNQLSTVSSPIIFFRRKFITMTKSQHQQILTTIHVFQVYGISILGCTFSEKFNELVPYYPHQTAQTSV